jgi:hypothetical protein
MRCACDDTRLFFFLFLCMDLLDLRMDLAVWHYVSSSPITITSYANANSQRYLILLWLDSIERGNTAR